ncbi:hypothetical protein [Vibrio vulnificus]|uniref:Uncharacterized protein n=1 Tax=Vibrio vulnificus TaxID=672 RepID=A0A2S3QYN8_VIBVL|nr:hypothetical protein [Vibrio vulnificus]ELL0595315.1 hypothetical protein [Vibrio vulnificus]ELP6757245.1 hypothetical protein [Vibrio vulnificus]MBN8087372.1 hypothetical protein [Vibrio vulnificus]MBN8115891.1 hypothetical protein [Vibrio vulnificus]MDK2618524.1 hypothetical protein [Vibrio vulnificus]
MKRLLALSILSLSSLSVNAWEPVQDGASMSGDNGINAVLALRNGAAFTSLTFNVPESYKARDARCIVEVDGKKLKDGTSYSYLNSDKKIEATLAFNIVNKSWDGQTSVQLQKRDFPAVNQLKRGNVATLRCAEDGVITDFNVSLRGFTKAFNNLYK